MINYNILGYEVDIYTLSGDIFNKDISLDSHSYSVSTLADYSPIDIYCTFIALQVYNVKQ